jgi:hypothetical protein
MVTRSEGEAAGQGEGARAREGAPSARKNVCAGVSQPTCVTCARDIGIDRSAGRGLHYLLVSSHCIATAHV